MKLPSSRVLFAVGLPIFLGALAIIPTWKLVALFGGAHLASVEFPLGNVEDVAVDPQGRVYVADGFHSRVQRYSPKGEFQRGWFISTAGAFALRTTADGRVLVATARGNKLLTYDADGELLEAREHLEEDRQGEFASERETTGPYAVRHVLVPHVVDTQTGRTVVATPWYKRLVAGPFPAVLYAVIGVALLWASEWRQRREQAATSDTPAAPQPQA